MKKYFIKQTLRAKAMKGQMKQRAAELLRDKQGMSEIVAVVGIIIAVLVILAVIFMPQISSYIKDTVMPAVEDTTSKLVNYK